MSARASLAVAALLVASFTATATAAPSDVETRVDATQVTAGETVTLQLRLRGSLVAKEPDLTPLRSGFEILDVGRSQRTSIVNGVYDRSSDWTITLLPKETGSVEIPALPVGSAFSEPRSIRVVAAGSGTAAPGDVASSADAPVFVRLQADRADPYEQERVLLHVRLYAAPEILQGSLSEPEIEGATVERLGGDRSTHEEVSGKSYSVIERTYTVLADAPGTLRVSPVRFEGMVRDDRPAPRRRRLGGFGQSLIDQFFSGPGLGDDLFGSTFDRGRRRVVARSQPLDLEVRPRPEASQGVWWLPAHDVTLTEDWEPAPGTVHVGQALTRRIILHADGAGAAQLPPLATPDRDDLKMYLEAPDTTESEAGSERLQEITIIPTRPGRLALPPIEVAWWDIDSDAPRVAELAARTIEVLPAVAGESPPPPRSAPAAPQPARPEATPHPGPHPAIPAVRDLAPWALGLALGGLLAAVVWRLRRRARSRAPAGPTRRTAERRLRRACRRRDPAAAERALHDLMRARGRHLDARAWARSLGCADLERVVARLQSVRYSTGREEWQGDGLWAAYRSTRKRRRAAARAPRGGGLPPLYPPMGSEGRARGAR